MIAAADLICCDRAMSALVAQSKILGSGCRPRVFSLNLADDLARFLDSL
jgi:hypothetical protein